MTRVTFKYLCFIAATPDQVWEGLTTSEFTKQYWHQSNIESDFEEGAPLVFKLLDDRVAVVGKILKADKPNHLAYTWRFTEHTSMEMKEDTTVIFTLEAIDGGTKLLVVHEGYEEGDPVFDAISGGWPAIICSLKSLLETGKPMQTAR